MEPGAVLDLIVPHLDIASRSQVGLTCKELSVILGTNLFKSLKVAHETASTEPFLHTSAISVKMYALVAVRQEEHRELALNLMERSVCYYKPSKMAKELRHASGKAIAKSLRAVTMSLGICDRSKAIYSRWMVYFPVKHGANGTYFKMTYEEVCSRRVRRRGRKH